MSFSFLGTWTTGQFEQLRKFAKVQEQDLKKRAEFLRRKLSDNGIFVTEYDEASYHPIRYSVTPFSYASKLFQAYRALGGHPETEFLLRTRDQPVFLTRGTSINTEDSSDTTSGYSDTYSNGRRYRGSQRFDRDVAVQVEKFKGWQLEVIKRKREHLEYKIKRAIDYSDQLLIEAEMIEAMLAEDSATSIDAQVTKVNLIATRTGAANVIQDMFDLFGFGIGRTLDQNSTASIEEADAERLR